MSRAGRRLLAALSVLAAWATPALAQELHGRFRISTQEVEEEGRTLDIFQQDYQLWYRIPVTHTVKSIVRLRYVTSDADDDSATLSLDGSRDVLEPNVELAWRTRLFDVSSGFRYTKERRRENGVTDEDSRSDWYSRLNWRPVDLPELSLSYNQLRFDPEDDPEEQDTRLFAETSYSAGPVAFNYNINQRKREDDTTDFERESTLQALNVDYRGRFVSNRLSLNTGLALQRQETKQTARQPVDAETPVETFAGLFAIDPTPLMDTLPPEPGLVDGDTLSPTAVALGGTAFGGGIDRNIGVDLDRPEKVDRLEIWMDAALSTLAASRFSWALYTSNDNLTWSLADPFVDFGYNSVFNRFELRFTAVTARFVKVVNTAFDATFGPAFVTEIVPTVTEQIVGVDRDTDDLDSVNLSLSYAPSRSWNLSSSSFIGREREGNNGVTVNEEDRFDQSLSALFRPRDDLSATGLVRWRIRDPDLGAEITDFAWTLGINAAPYETLDLGLSFNQSLDRENSSRDREISRWTFRTALELFSALNVAFDAAYSSTFDFDQDRRARQASGRIIVFTQPRPELTLASDFLIDRQKTRGPMVTGDGENDSTTWSNRVLYRPSPTFNLEVELRDEDLSGSSGLAQEYNLDWLPFPGGALQLTLAYAADVAGAFGGDRDQFRAQLRWQVRNGVVLDLNRFRDTIRNGGPSQDIDTVSAILEIRF